MLKEHINNVQLTDIKLHSIIQAIRDIRIGVIGDGCLDVYWYADMKLSELSRETPHHPMPVVKESMYPGGGANVAANANSLKANKVYMLSIIGNDWRGNCLAAALKDMNVDTRFMLKSDSRITPTYCKPIRGGFSDIAYEDPRIDFDNYVSLTKAEESSIIKNLHRLAENVDIIVVCDQLKYGVINERIRQELAELYLKGKHVVVDSRMRIGLYSNVIIKPNDLEAISSATGGNIPDNITLEAVLDSADKLFRQNNSPVIITMGNKGSLWYDGKTVSLADAVQVAPPVDTVGAGDAFLSAFSCAYAAGFTGPECICFANMASSIVVKKVGMTGSATPDEIIKQHSMQNS